MSPANSAVTVRRRVAIPMADGVRLSGTLWLPAGDGPFPALLTYHPYHKYGGPELWRHFARRGYAALLVDFRGTGNSEGVCPYPMDPQEWLDGHALVEWLAAQPWCTGDVGMFGMSYGGITALSTAATHPPHLRAIIPVHATYDCYEHYMTYNGCPALLWVDTNWGGRMAASNLVPPPEPDPEGRWLAAWRERLERNTPWMLSWHGRPPEPDFWARRRIPVAQIAVPSFFIGAWRDQYPGRMLELYQAVKAPKRVLMGPWKHAWAGLASPAPTGGLREMERWWDRWLKGVRNGVDDEPPIAIYVQRFDDQHRAPDAPESAAGGEWRYEAQWPIARTETQRYFLHRRGRLETGGPAPEHGHAQYDYDSRTGTGSIGYYGHSAGVPVGQDQSFDDRRSITFTTPPLAADTELTGGGAVRCFVSATIGQLNLVAKLCEVDPYGLSRVITQGWADVTRRSAHDPQTPLQSREVRQVAIDLRPSSYLVRSGRRLRLSISGSDFPELWPTPQPYQLWLHYGPDHPAALDLPIVPAAAAAEVRRPAFGPPADDLGSAAALRAHHSYHVRHDLMRPVTRVETVSEAENRVDAVTTLLAEHRAVMETDAAHPWLSAAQTTNRIVMERPQGRVETRVQMRATRLDVAINAEIDVDGQPFFRRSWSVDAPAPPARAPREGEDA